MAYWCGITAILIMLQNIWIYWIFVLIFLEKIKAALTWNPVQLVDNVSVHWIGGKNTFFKKLL